MHAWSWTRGAPPKPSSTFTSDVSTMGLAVGSAGSWTRRSSQTADSAAPSAGSGRASFSRPTTPAWAWSRSAQRRVRPPARATRPTSSPTSTCRWEDGFALFQFALFQVGQYWVVTGKCDARHARHAGRAHRCPPAGGFLTTLYPAHHHALAVYIPGRRRFLPGKRSCTLPQAKKEREQEAEAAADKGWYRNASGHMSFSDLAGVNIRVASGVVEE